MTWKCCSFVMESPLTQLLLLIPSPHIFKTLDVLTIHPHTNAVFVTENEAFGNLLPGTVLLSFFGLWQQSVRHYHICLHEMILCNSAHGQNSAGANLAHRTFYLCTNKCTITLPLLLRDGGVRMHYKSQRYAIQHSHKQALLPMGGHALTIVGFII